MNLNDLKNSNYVIYHMYNDKYIDSLYKFPLLLFIKNLFRFFLIGIWHAILTIKNFNLYLKNCYNKTIFLSLSKNNYNVLEPLYNQFKNEKVFISTDYRNNKEYLLLTKFFPFIISLFFLPLNLIKIPFLNKSIKKRTILFLHEYLLYDGYNIFFDIFLKYKNPSKIVIANDHVQLTRIIIKKAKKYNITTYYLQNGCITKSFPILSTDYALLEGDYSKDIYSIKNLNKTKIKIIGMTKVDNHSYSLNNKSTLHSIGICTTATTAFNDIEKMIDFLLKHFKNINFFLRPHPSEMIENKYKTFYNHSSVKISNSNKTHPIEFLKNVDLIISGNSAILLEAALMNIYPIYFFTDNNIEKYNDKNFDRYGFIKNKLAKEATSLEDLKIIINNAINAKPNIVQNATYYCDHLKNKDSLTKANSIIANT